LRFHAAARLSSASLDIRRLSKIPNRMRTWSLHILDQISHLVLSLLHLLVVATVTTFTSRTVLQVENLALRHQLAVLRRSVKQP
jgi:hypothetical protein